jgi:hypothetical protein
MHQKTPEDTKSLGTKVEDQQLPGGAARPHHHATHPPVGFSGGPVAARWGRLASPPCHPPPVGFFHALLEYSSTTP